MSNTKLFLLIGTSLSFLPTLVYSQCVATQDCETLGYTETSCNGGKGVKCPFGNKWACLGANEEECMKIACEKLGFKYTCSGTGYAGGAGSACDGKYTYCNCKNGYNWNGNSCKKEVCSSSYKYTCSGTGYISGTGASCDGKYILCTCASGYEWENGNCQKKEILTGPDGDVYKCNGKIVGIKTPGINFYVAIQDIKNNWTVWSPESTKDDCGNGRIPTKQELLSIYKNKTEINKKSVINGGRNLTESYNGWYWSSDALPDSAIYYCIHMSDGDIMTKGNTDLAYTRAVY